MKNDIQAKLESYRYLWEDESGRYVLIQTDKDSQDIETCLVYDLETKTALLEEDDDVSLAIKSRLAEKRVSVLTKIPQ